MNCPQEEKFGNGPISVELEELVLEGFPPAQRHAIGDAVQVELSRLFALHGGNWARSGDVSLDSIDAGSFSLRQGETPGNIGARIAANLYRGLSR